MSEVARRFCTTPERAKLVQGLVTYRKALAAIGIIEGLQWIDGSFLENVELLRKQAPKDIDVVSFFLRPEAHRADPAWVALLAANRALFVSQETKKNYLCDAYAVDLQLPADVVIKQITYWYGLFTHQRDSFLWKGVLQLPLSSDDDAALDYIGKLKFSP